MTTNAERSQRKEIKIPGPDHPITIKVADGLVQVTVDNTIIAESSRALVLEEKGYRPVFYITARRLEHVLTRQDNSL